MESQSHEASAHPRDSREAVHRFMLDPRSYSHAPPHVELIETHISWVFLAGSLVYKQKKPVRYDFLDFSTLDARHAACEAEVRLNRRLAPHVYLGVESVVRRPDGTLALEAEGTPVEWLVKMRRLDTERSLDRLIETGQVKPRDVASLAQLLADFYRTAQRVALSPEEYVSRFEHHVRANGAVLDRKDRDLPQSVVQRVQAAQLQWLGTGRRRIEERVTQRCIVDGHGDLRPEHICFDPEAVVFDCIEFSAEFRAVDILDELCFLAMECDRLGASWIGKAILDDYLEREHDQPPPRLAMFYKCYRAAVRAKVAVLRADQHTGEQRRSDMDEAVQYLDLADQYAAQFARRLIIIVRGLMGTGKSTLARAIAESLGARLLQTDRIRREMFGPSSDARQATYGSGRYRPENRRLVYDEMFKRARSWLGAGLSVVLDGTFLTASTRREAASLTGDESAELLVVRCRCPEEVARRRIERRREGPTLSDGRAELLPLQQAEEESDTAELPNLEVDTTRPLSEQLKAVFDRLAD